MAVAGDRLPDRRCYLGGEHLHLPDRIFGGSEDEAVDAVLDHQLGELVGPLLERSL